MTSTSPSERTASPAAKKQRKKSPPRTAGTGRVSPHSLHWQDPEYRARWRASFEKHLQKRRENPEKYFRRGVPDGMRKPEAMAKWAEARAKAREIMEDLEDAGVIQPAVPGTDAEKANKALEEAFVMAMSPLRDSVKLQAINTVLNFTKAKPAQTINQKLSSEDWLKEVVTDLKANHGTDQSA